MVAATLLKKIFGSRNQRIIKSFSKKVHEINALEADINQLSDQNLLSKTNEFKNRIRKGESLDSILSEAFAVVREAAKRTLNMRHFDVQLIGGMVLHHGKIAEMHTGEGKTLVATLPAYLNALSGKSVHIITVNDYLATRDANWMRPVYEALGMTVGTIIANMPTEEKQAAYACDIVYGTNNEYGFDYLRDNMAFSTDQRVQKDRAFAIVDEVDSILIDEARTPLIISGPAETSSDLYYKLNSIVPLLKKQENPEDPKCEGDFAVDEKHKQATISERGHERIEEILIEHKLVEDREDLYSPQNISIFHHLNAALRAHYLFQKDVDYIVAEGEIVIVDEHTGRTMPGRRWSDGLHQAIEAKEGVEIKQENQTLASITFQNYFRLYDKLSGMTGTADTEAYEFQSIYGLEVVVIPTNKPIARIDQSDQIYLSAKEKFEAIIEDVKLRVNKNQPVLLGTASIETSEFISKLLKKSKIAHQVLNAKYHQKEATIIAEAGRPGVVTIATNMAGRGTDIVLGGSLDAELAKLDNPTEDQVARLKADWQKRHDTVLAAGGLYVLGSERHESRRIDNQLRGRSGRQGDPGETRFYLSMDDNLMRIFASDRMKNVMAKLGMEGQAIESGMITRSIEGAQRRVEGLHFEIRKQLLEYDDIANEQRKIIYDQRDYLMTAEDVHETVLSLMNVVITDLVHRYMPPEVLEEEWDVATLEKELANNYHLDIKLQEALDSEQSMGVPETVELVVQKALENYKQKQMNFEPSVIYQIEKSILLQVLDNQWKEHLVAMDYLRQSVGLRGYAQKDPRQEYKREAFLLFESLLANYRQEVCSVLMHYNMFSEEQLEHLEEHKREQAEREREQMQEQHKSLGSVYSQQEVGGAGEVGHGSDGAMGQTEFKPETVRRDHPKIGRNDVCFCGSGKKYKFCHGKI